MLASVTESLPTRHTRMSQHTRAFVLVTALLVSMMLPMAAAVQTSWLSWGSNSFNWRFSNHSCINKAALKTGMTPKWSFMAGGVVAATPSVCGGFVYLVDWTADIYKLDMSGKQVWTISLKTLVPGQRKIGSRSSPVLTPDCRTLYTFTQWGTAGAHIVAVDTATGKGRFTKIIDPQPTARVTMSATFWQGNLYVGMTSNTEGTIFNASEATFRGSMLKVSGVDGSVRWQSFTCPLGFSGVGIWGSAPVVDTRRNQVCVGTGNNYAVPTAMTQCMQLAGTNTVAVKKCADTAPLNMIDSLVCFDLTTGARKWSRRDSDTDLYLPGVYYGLDHDYAQAPILINKPNPAQDVLIGTSKAGRIVALRPATGAIAWGPKLVYTTIKGGFAQFGSCSNGVNICVGLFWYTKKVGVVTCMDVNTGAPKWSWVNQDGGVYGALTCTQGVVFAPLFDAVGSLVALDMTNGKELGRFPTGATLFCGPAIVNGVAYLGSGYKANGGVPSNVFHAVNIPLIGAC